MADSRAEKILLASMRAKGPSEIEFGINKAEVAPNNPQIASQEEERHRMLGFLLRIKDSLPGGLTKLTGLFSSHRIGAELVVLCRHIFNPSPLSPYAYSLPAQQCVNPRCYYEKRSAAGLNSCTQIEFLRVFPARPYFSRAYSYPKK
jgi:hypothetical protein